MRSSAEWGRHTAVTSIVEPRTVRFRSIDLLIGPGVFTPQPETEVVVEAVVDELRTLDRPVVVDLCTGSGTIAFSVAAEVAGAVVHAVEADPVAARWARANAERLGLPVKVVNGDAGDALRELDGTVDVVVSNPPYVAEHELDDVDPEVRDKDPHFALLAGPDGLDVVRLVEQTAWRLLRPGGLVVVEHSDRQGVTAPRVFGRWADVRDFPDQEGRDRFLTARRRLAPPERGRIRPMDDTDAPDTAMATGNDEGTPGEQVPQTPPDASSATASAETLTAVEQDAPLRVRVEDAPDPDTPVFREP